MYLERRFTLSIIIIWLFNVSGILGILLGYQDWFLPVTFVNLLIYFFLILWNARFNKVLIFSMLIPFSIGLITEFLGVNYGLIFGDYQYGNNLGYKVFGVPLIIGINWAILVYCSAALVRKIHKNIVLSSVLGAILMVLLDIVIEVVAPRFDFWMFEGGVVPFQNYVGWFFTAFTAHLFFQKSIKVFHFELSLHIFIAILVFFTFFSFF